MIHNKKHIWRSLILAIILTLSIYSLKSQNYEYYPAKVTITYADGRIIEDSWEIDCDFDDINSLVYFNMRPNKTEEFTIIHKIYNIRDSFDPENVLLRSEYILDDMAVLYIKYVYDKPEDRATPTGCYIKLTETIPYSIRRMDIKTIEFSFFRYF